MGADKYKTKAQLVNELALARHKSEEYSTLLEKSQDGIIVLQDSLVKFANSKAAEITGFSAEDVLGKPFIDFVAPQYRDLVMGRYRKRLAGESIPSKYEMGLLSKDGSTIPVEVNASLIVYEGKTATLSMVRDITERKKMEEGLTEREELLKAIIMNAPIGIATSDAHRHFLSANEAFCEVVGYTEAELCKMTFRDITHPDDIEASVAKMDDFDAGEESSFCLEKRYIRKDGTVIIGSVIVSAVRNNEGKPYIYIAELEDITARKQAEEVLKLQATLLDAVSDCVFVHDLEGNLIHVNKVTCSTLGYAGEELLNMNLSQISDSETTRLITPRIKEILEKRYSTFEVTGLRKDGSKIPLEIHAALLEIGDRKLIISSGHDITERKRMQEQLLMQDRLVSIGQLVSGVAHELNNPLTSVVGFSELLLERDLPDDIKADVKIVNDEAKRTALIVKNLLSFARQQPQEKQAVDINEPIQTVLQIRSHEQGTNNIKVKAHLAPDQPLIMGNSSQLQQVFFNIIINAEQAMLEAYGKGILTITTEQKGSFIRASIADDGPGIPREHMARLFSPFFTTKPIGKGTGLGLSICQGIVAEHGGRIWAESEPGKGATFVVELPVNPVAS